MKYASFLYDNVDISNIIKIVALRNGYNDVLFNMNILHIIWVFGLNVMGNVYLLDIFTQHSFLGLKDITWSKNNELVSLFLVMSFDAENECQTSS